MKHMTTPEYLDTCLATLMSDGWSVSQMADGTRILSAGDTHLGLYLGVEREPRLYVRGKICAFPKTDQAEALLEDLLAANFFWQGTEGSVLSLKDGNVYLTGRFDSADVLSETNFRDFVARCLDMAESWRERIALAEVK